MSDASAVTKDRDSYLAGNSIVNAVLAADCIYDEECRMNDERFRQDLATTIKSKVSHAQCENLVAILQECAKDKDWTDGTRRY